MTKILIGSVILFAGIFIPFLCHFTVVGWMAMTMRTTARGEKGLAPLDWDFDQLIYYLILGMESSIVMWVWSLPFTILAVALAVCAGMAGALTSAIAELPPEYAMIIFPLIGVTFVFVMVVGALPGFVASMRVRLTGEAEEGFAFGEIFRFTGRYFFQLCFGLFVTWVVGIPITLLGLLFCFIGGCPAYILTHISANDVLTQAYLQSLNEGFAPLNLSGDPPAPLPVGPPASPPSA